ncbi:MAG: beta-mannosidase [Clostridia bacterium]|nr:beta-mannosidase [Clostridia bacterium]
MKKPLWFILIVLTLLLVISAQAEGTVTYEAEEAVIHGSLRVSAEAAASNRKVVGLFQNQEDSLVFTVSVPAEGLYDLSFVTKGVGGNKTNNVLVDGKQIGTIQSIFFYSPSEIKGVHLTAGEHQIALTVSGGYFNVDCLKVSPAPTIPNSVFKVEPTLINPNATEEARKLFAYLCESYGKVTLSGQFCDNGFDGPEIKAVYEVTDKYPAILGLDMMDYTPSRQAMGGRSTAVETAIDYHNAGGIITFNWHWGAPKQYIRAGVDGNGNPNWWGGFYTANVNYDITTILDGSDAEGKKLLDKDIEGIAKQLLRLQDAGVPVLWRPLHEASGGWFWWGAKGPEPCKQLWIYLYDQLTNVYGCNNLIWVWNGQAADWYPGDEYVDIISEDIYADKRSYSAQIGKFMEALDYTDTNKIIALSENGVVFDMEQVLLTNARWAWFNTWSGEFIQRDGQFSDEYTEYDMLYFTYNSDYVITLDELPALYE